MSAYTVVKSADDVAKAITTTAWPYYSSVNADINPQDDQWFSLAFLGTGQGPLTFCGDRSERGIIDIIFSCPPGSGYDVIKSCEDMAKAFMVEADKKTYSGSATVTFLGIMTPEVFQDSHWFKVVIGIEYIHIY